MALWDGRFGGGPAEEMQRFSESIGVDLRMFNEDIDVYVRVSRVGRSSLTFLLEIHPQGTDDLRASGEVVWVNTDQTTHLSVEVPEELKDLLCSFEGVSITS